MYGDPAPICFNTGWKYYVSFFDAFSIISCLNPISLKSDVSYVFLKFQSYVEYYLIQKLKLSNLTGRCISLSHKKFQNQVIIHLILCPHMHQQNGLTQSKLCHIIKVGLAFLSQANIAQHC